MAVEYDDDFKTMTLTCDNCGFESTYDGSWNECIEQAKLDGWRIFKGRAEFEHYCDTCVDLGEAGS